MVFVVLYNTSVQLITVSLFFILNSSLNYRRRNKLFTFILQSNLKKSFAMNVSANTNHFSEQKFIQKMKPSHKWYHKSTAFPFSYKRLESGIKKFNQLKPCLIGTINCVNVTGFTLKILLSIFFVLNLRLGFKFITAAPLILQKMTGENCKNPQVCVKKAIFKRFFFLFLRRMLGAMKIWENRPKSFCQCLSMRIACMPNINSNRGMEKSAFLLIENRNSDKLYECCGK